MECPDPEVWIDLAFGGIISPRESALLVLHAEACESCRPLMLAAVASVAEAMLPPGPETAKEAALLNDLDSVRLPRELAQRLATKMGARSRKSRSWLWVGLGLLIATIGSFVWAYFFR